MDNLKGKDATFSIQNIIELGPHFGRNAGEWFGPSTIIQIFSKLNILYGNLPDLIISDFPEGVVFLDELYSQAYHEKEMNQNYEEDVKGNASNLIWNNKSIILLLGFRLGIDYINIEYLEVIKRLMLINSF